MHGIYIPYWTFDAHVVCPWQAEAGHYYYTTETYRDNQGRSQTRQVRHVRWEPASGEVRHFFDDEPVPGTHGVSHTLLEQVQPFPTASSCPTTPRSCPGFVVEHYQLVLLEASQHSEASMTQPVARHVRRPRCPGDTHRNLEIQPSFSARTFKHILVPVWLLSYTYGNRAWQVVVNGYTGKMAGEYPKSPWKIALLVLLAIIVVLVLIVQDVWRGVRALRA